MNDSDLKRTERLAFRAAVDTGLWDVLIAAVVSMLALAPLLSGYLGDFWSSAVFLPLFAAVFLTIRAVQQRIVIPRVGAVKFGPERMARLRRLTVVMLVVNIAALVLGAFAAARGGVGGATLYPAGLALVLLMGFSLGSYFLSIPRYFVYGLLLVAAPLVGEELWQRGHATHHGFPVVFGVAAVVILVGGLVRFARHVVWAGGAERPGRGDVRG